MLGMDDPEVLSAIQKAATSSSVLRAVARLTAEGEPIRGCQVNPDRAHLQALQSMVGWTVGGYDTRPTDESMRRKQDDRLHVLVTYLQPPIDPTAAPQVAMYDYLCDTIFGVPMRAIGREVVAPDYLDESGKIIKPRWVEADWEKFRISAPTLRLAPALRPNRYPYQLPAVGGHLARHWVLWYFHVLGEDLPNPSDEEIEADLLTSLLLAARAEGFESFDYIWYRNPAMSVPDMFHVQVFWRPTCGPASAGREASRPTSHARQEDTASDTALDKLLLD